MANGLTNFACLVLACMIVTGPTTTKAVMNCGTVSGYMAPCIGYLTRGENLSGQCCTGVTNLNGMARSTPDRQQACRCLQNSAKALGRSLNAGRASGLPKACRVNIPFQISPNTNCNAYVL
ncbi:unnamed protein product [Cochlearia groenlandica]